MIMGEGSVEFVSGESRYGTMKELAEALRPEPPRPQNEWPTTAAQFAQEYAERSGVTVEWLRQHGREPAPCDCGDMECEGWQMTHGVQKEDTAQ